jgi:hypothetical protein
MIDATNLKPPSRRRLVQKLSRQSVYAGGVIIISLLIGMVGYHVTAGFGWVDSFENASMLLGGMGPVGPVEGTTGKIFAGVFALYSGLVFLAVTALVLTPVFHHVLHRFHWDATHPE